MTIRIKASNSVWIKIVSDTMKHYPFDVLLQVFQTGSKTEVEEQLKLNNKEFIWHDDNSLECWFSNPATNKHHITGISSTFKYFTLNSFHKLRKQEVKPFFGKAKVMVTLFCMNTRIHSDPYKFLNSNQVKYLHLYHDIFFICWIILH